MFLLIWKAKKKHNHIVQSSSNLSIGGTRKQQNMGDHLQCLQQFCKLQLAPYTHLGLDAYCAAISCIDFYLSLVQECKQNINLSFSRKF